MPGTNSDVHGAPGTFSPYSKALYYVNTQQTDLDIYSKKRYRQFRVDTPPTHHALHRGHVVWYRMLVFIVRIAFSSTDFLLFYVLRNSFKYI